ncbi:hypothetical protein OESDEN_11699 [Oesophagostomum dentatum]|uniref:RRM domain-containing protein n=1 Tax=Oesophagostomum dentatum TaxID=61180 RepID=A0A0B1ST62_OESDE|nr:hypothetical protein OESDEN_11699 [Oesophagostomum dentatum]
MTEEKEGGVTSMTTRGGAPGLLGVDRLTGVFSPVDAGAEARSRFWRAVTAGQRQLPPHVTNKVQELEDGTSVLLTADPQMEALGLPAYPPLPGNTDLAKVEEIRRTIYVGNLPKGVDGQAVLDFFNNFVGEVMYLRMATGPDTLPCAYAYIEFTNQTSVPIALQNNGIDYQGRPLRIQHSRVAIIKPQAKSADQALEEINDHALVRRFVVVAHRLLVAEAGLRAAVEAVRSLARAIADEADQNHAIAKEAVPVRGNEAGAAKDEEAVAALLDFCKELALGHMKK